MSFKPFIVSSEGDKPDSPTLERLKKERKNVPYIVIKDNNNKNTVWERQKFGRVKCVHNDRFPGMINVENEENTIVCTALRLKDKGWEVFYCNKKEVFLICL